MQIDEGMDTGPIVVQKEVKFPKWQALKCLASLTEAVLRRKFSAENYPCISELATKEIPDIPNRKELIDAAFQFFVHSIKTLGQAGS